MSRATTVMPFVLLVAVLALSGCAAIRRAQAADTEELLRAAGFQMRPADALVRLVDHQTVRPFRLVAGREDGKVVYAYVDPENCHCLYVGGPEEHSRYLRLSEERELARNLDIGVPAGAGR